MTQKLRMKGSMLCLLPKKKDIRANDYSSEFLNLNVSGMFLWIP